MSAACSSGTRRSMPQAAIRTLRSFIDGCQNPRKSGGELR
jgi:hypothetical protein